MWYQATFQTSLKSAKEGMPELSELRDATKVMIGGAPITQEYACEIGADGYSNGASAAVTLARQLVGAG